MRTSDETRLALIFGGAGFIGANLARRLLLETGARVHIFDNLSRPGVRNNLQQLQKIEAASSRDAACCVSTGTGNQSGRLKITVGDIRDAAAVERAVRDATEIYQFAAQVAVTTSIADPRCDFETNTAGTFSVLEAARKSGNQPFVLFTSTNKVYGEMVDEPLLVSKSRYCYAKRRSVSEDQPLDFHSPYGCSKGAADQYVREYSRTYGLPSVVFRMSCIAGEMQYGSEDQGWVAHFLYTALKGAPLTIYGDGRQVRDVLYVGDLVRAFDAVRAALPKTSGQIYNVGGGERNTISLMELMEEIEDLTGRRVQLTHDQRRPGDQLIYVSDCSKINRDAGWKPRSSVRETLRAIYNFWKEHPALFGRPAEADSAVAPATASVALLERTA